MNDIFEGIKPEGNTVYVFIGNELREDDGAGPYIAKNIKNEKIRVINAGSVFENSVSEIIDLKPDKLVIFDAAIFEGNPGDIKVLDERNIKNYKMLSTHTIPLNILLDLIKDEVINVKIVIVGILPQSMDYKEGLSEKVKESCDKLIEYLNSI